MTAAEEVGWDIGGAHCAGKRWRNGPRPVLALHGWLDNAASFDVLAPLLADADVVALDLSGHGLSSHRPLQASYNIWDDLPDILRVADQLGWERFHLLGHSRGAIIGALLTAALPQRVASLILLDALRPPPLPLEDTFRQLGEFLRTHTQPPRSMSCYPSPERALEVRCRVSGMSERAARPIVERGLQRVEAGWQWRADPRLHLPSALKLSAEHNRLLIECVARHAHLLLTAQGGLNRRLEESGEVQGLRRDVLPGSHHFHLEDAAAEIAARAAALWREQDAVERGEPRVS